MLRSIQAGNDWAIKWLEDRAAVGRIDGKAITAERLEVASFRHLTSRALDQFPHHDNVVINTVRTADGTHRGLWPREHVESRMRWKSHVRFRGRAGETHRSRDDRALRPDPYTYVATWSGFAFSAFVNDVCSRRIVGWRTKATMATELPLDALEVALWTRRTHLTCGSQEVAI